MNKILIANRGEIARRIMRSCRRMGIATVAVFSDADAGAAFVAEADEAVRLGPAPAAESYLAVDKIMAAAARTGADGLHPGYGFLSENPALARACAEAGVTFIGPRAEVIAALGSKREAKRIAVEAGVPVIPGHDGADQSTAALAARARELGFPLLLKASAGGGGKGMRVVHTAAGLEEAIDSAKREAAGAFGDDTMLIERYIESPRHVEIQILGDHHGDVIHLYERECSVQRRHQKIIEESPSPAVDAALRQRMGEAAVAVARAVGYTNAGTVEFILAPDRQFYFLEVNTRLQVEHPVTELVTGLDLVREQIRVARGERVTPAPELRGAAVECRLYAEDPDAGFLPASGRVVDWHAPAAEGLRIDTALDGPADVSIYYDPMLAKVICWAPTRAEAVQQLARNLRALSVQGIPTNRALLVRILEHPAFAAGELDTHFLDRHADALRAPEPPRAEAAVAGALHASVRRAAARSILPAMEPGFRNNRFADERVDYDGGVSVSYRNLGRARFAVDGRALVVVRADATSIELEDAGLRRRYRVVSDGDRRFVQRADGVAVTLTELPRFPDAAAADVEGGLVAPMPGAVVKVMVSEGQQVTAGDTLVVLEAMKMEHAVKAPADGVVEQLLVREGDQVDTDQLLAVVG